MFQSASIPAHGSPRHEGVSPFGLAAMAAVLHLAVLAGRVSPRGSHPRPIALLAWQVPPSETAETRLSEENAPSNPTRTYCAGRLALTAGMAVLALARWLHVMRVRGTHAD